MNRVPEWTYENIPIMPVLFFDKSGVNSQISAKEVNS